MSDYQTKYSPLFLASTDESYLEKRLRSEVPEIAFVDGSTWKTQTPPEREDLRSCQSSIVFLWDKSACRELPFMVRNDGTVQGPTSGVVIQYFRSVEKDGVLLSGDIGIGYKKNDQAMAAFVKKVWRILKEMNAGALESFDPTTGVSLDSAIRTYIVGAGAIALAMSGVVLTHCSGSVRYRPNCGTESR